MIWKTINVMSYNKIVKMYNFSIFIIIIHNCVVSAHSENPEVIFLQEVVTDSLPIIRARCMPDYDIFLGLEGKRRGPVSR